MPDTSDQSTAAGDGPMTLAMAPAMAMGTLYGAMANSQSILFQNAVAQQKQDAMLSQAATVLGLLELSSLPTTAAAVAAGKLSQAQDAMQQMVSAIVKKLG